MFSFSSRDSFVVHLKKFKNFVFVGVKKFISSSCNLTTFARSTAFCCSGLLCVENFGTQMAVGNASGVLFLLLRRQGSFVSSRSRFLLVGKA